VPLARRTPKPRLGSAKEDEEPASSEPLIEIWSRLARPFNVPETVDALLGLSPTVVRQFIGAVLATSNEAHSLLDQMPNSMRALATSMTTYAERCHGDVRGPILWSETMSARASSNGAEDLFVCSAATRAYDITENRVLVAALNEVLNAAKDARIVSEKAYDDATLRSAREMGERARLFLQHPTLRSVTVEKPNGRALKRTRSGKKKDSYLPAIAMLDRVGDPVSPGDLVPFCDRRTRAQHRVLMTIVERLEQEGGRLPEFRAEQSVLYAGPLQYHHPRTLGNIERISGILIGNLLVDVPDRLRERSRRRAEEDLEARAGGRKSMVIMNRDDIDQAFSLAVNLARR
jgi:hypothetical protein